MLHAVEKIQALLQEDPKFKQDHRHAHPEHLPVIHRAPRSVHRLIHRHRAASETPPPSALSRHPRHPHALRLLRRRSYLSSFSETRENLMEVHVDRDAFFRGLQLVHNIVEPRQTFRSSPMCWWRREREAVRLTATDLEVGCPCLGAGQGDQAGHRSRMSRAKAPGDRQGVARRALALRVQDNAWVALSCGGASYKLVGWRRRISPRSSRRSRRPGSAWTARCSGTCSPRRALPCPTTRAATR